MLTDVLRLQLLATRSAIDAALTADRAERESVQSGTACTHPKEARVTRAAMGRPNAAACRQCGAKTEDGVTWAPSDIARED